MLTSERRSEVVYPELAGRVAVVTGAARGIGAAHVSALLRSGVKVVAADLDGDSLVASLESHAADSVIVHPGDVSVQGYHRELASRALEEFGSLDVWVNNAGVFPNASVWDISPEQMTSTIGVNVNGVLWGAQAAAEHMGDGGVIINMASIAAYAVRAGQGAYGVSKAAVEHLTHFLAVELGPRGIRVNAIAPGVVRTGMTTWIHDDPEMLEKVLSTIPLRRTGEPEDIADAMLFLASDSSRFVNGHTLVVDGGGRYR